MTTSATSELRELAIQETYKCLSTYAMSKQHRTEYSEKIVNNIFRAIAEALEAEAVTLYDWQEGSGYANRTAVPLDKINHILGIDKEES